MGKHFSGEMHRTKNPDGGTTIRFIPRTQNEAVRLQGYLKVGETRRVWVEMEVD